MPSSLQQVSAHAAKVHDVFNSIESYALRIILRNAFAKSGEIIASDVGWVHRIDCVHTSEGSGDECRIFHRTDGQPSSGLLQFSQVTGIAAYYGYHVTVP